MIKIDEKNGLVVVETPTGEAAYQMDTPEAFKIVSDAWLRCGWDTKYVYSFSWMGRPVIQLPEDMIRIQEVLYRVKPNVIVETGVAHGGSLVFYASLCKAMGKGRVIGVDIEIRPHNRAAIETHEMSPLITLIEGSSTEEGTMDQVKALIQPGESVLVILDSNHSKAHVLAELQSYGRLVTPDSYIVATDGIMSKVVGAPRTQPDWSWNNPLEAAREFADTNPDFVLEEPIFPFNEGRIQERVTYWPQGFLRRLQTAH
ncbi:cephalosporin hydroxylase family protein [Microvirga lenta]|uniref:cephalosporin hydroxylase family protein n=1 Tax=Microvirga lenta TaxID=2881337 RepID=UPI001CFCDE05|nr:CmcI family methyltransferase [Microvirga lenta]MCB5173555.1 cephalosporin hydroxylase family protein [Microvirga lenta]